MEAKGYNNSRIRLRLHQQTLREGLCLLSSLNKAESHLRFTKEGFSITCVTPTNQQGKKTKKAAAAETGKRSQADINFNAAELPKYDYRVVTAKESNPILHFECTANTSDFYKRVRGLKGVTIKLLLKFEAGECREIAFKLKGSSAITYLAVIPATRRIIHLNQLETWFKGKTPVLSPESSAFQSMIASAKQNGCTDVEFCVNKRTKAVSVRTWSNESMISADPLGDIDSDSSYEEDEEGDAFISRHVNLVQHDWVAQITRMSPDSLVRLYIKDEAEAPLIVTTRIGNYAEAVFCIPDSTID